MHCVKRLSGYTFIYPCLCSQVSAAVSHERVCCGDTSLTVGQVKPVVTFITKFLLDRTVAALKAQTCPRKSSRLDWPACQLESLEWETCHTFALAAERPDRLFTSILNWIGLWFSADKYMIVS